MTGRILVVDDQRAPSELLAGILQARGYEVSIAASGEAALEAVRGAGPDLVIADIRMPGMDGYELCRRLRAQADTALLPIPVSLRTRFATAKDRWNSRCKIAPTVPACCAAS